MPGSVLPDKDSCGTAAGSGGRLLVRPCLAQQSRGALSQHAYIGKEYRYEIREVRVLVSHAGGVGSIPAWVYPLWHADQTIAIP